MLSAKKSVSVNLISLSSADQYDVSLLAQQTLDFITSTSEWCTYARANRNTYAALAVCAFQRRFLLNRFRIWHHLTRHASQQPISDREHYRMWQNISVLMRIKIMVGIWKRCFRTQRQSFKSIGSVRHAMSLWTICVWNTCSVSSTGTEG